MSRDLLSGLWSGRTDTERFSAADWSDLLGQARSAGLMGRLAIWCERHGGLDAVPQGPRRHLSGAMMLVRRQEQEVHWEVDQLQRALIAVDTPVVLLKGAAYLLGALPCATGRLFADIDLLVRPTQLHAVEQALFVAGWIPTERDPYNVRYYRCCSRPSGPSTPHDASGCCSPSTWSCTAPHICSRKASSTMACATCSTSMTC
jgi:hypothetical protein